MEAKENMLSIVMLPWLAHGHVSPFLELAKKMGKRNHQLTVYLCSTKVILDSIKKRVNKLDQPFLHFIEIQLPCSDQELPPHHHTTNGLPLHLNHKLAKAFDNSSPVFSTILEQIKPDLVIYDFQQPWAPEVAASHSIPAVMFHTTSIAVVGYCLHKITKEGIKFPYPELIPQDSYRIKRHLEMKDKESSTNVEERVSWHFSYLRSSEIILSKTFGEVDEGYMDYVSSLIGKRVLPTGPLVKDGVEGETVSENGERVMDWLDKKEKASTVLVSFGSECYLSREEIEQMANGLEQSMVNFIWVIQFPFGEKISIEEAVSKTFLEKVGERGLVIDTWIPQGRILAHENTGGFITHCGWSSVTEAIGFGVPIIAMAMQYDQPINERLIVNAGVGKEVLRKDNECFEAKEIARVTREVVLENEGEKIRKKCKEMKEKWLKEGDDEKIDVIVKELRGLCTKCN